MQRRDFITAAAAVTAGTATLALPARAQGKPVEGTHYKRVAQVQPVAGNEVIEFFWYGCPTCHKLEPSLHAWLARKPAHVNFKRLPGVIREVSKAHQRIFFALEAMGAGDAVHARIFEAIQVQHKDLQNLPEIQAVVASLGLDTAKFAAMYQSFTVQTRCQQATALMNTLGLGGVPHLVVNGRWYTAPSMAGGHPEAMAVVDYLLALPRG